MGTCVCLCIHARVCVLMRITSCIGLLPCHLFVSHVLIFFSYMYTYWINDFWFLTYCILLSFHINIIFLNVLQTSPFCPYRVPDIATWPYQTRVFHLLITSWHIFPVHYITLAPFFAFSLICLSYINESFVTKMSCLLPRAKLQRVTFFMKRSYLLPRENFKLPYLPNQAHLDLGICSQLRSSHIHSIHKKSGDFINGNFVYLALICTVWSGRRRAGKKVTAVTFFRCPTVTPYQVAASYVTNAMAVDDHHCTHSTFHLIRWCRPYYVDLECHNTHWISPELLFWWWYIDSLLHGGSISLDHICVFLLTIWVSSRARPIPHWSLQMLWFASIYRPTGRVRFRPCLLLHLVWGPLLCSVIFMQGMTC